MITLKIFRIWQRHMIVWRKYLKEAILGTTGEPIIYLLALGYGMGHYVGEIGGLTYIQYIAPGLWLASAMGGASAECTYGAYTRMTTQQTYNAILAAPINTHEIVGAEILFGSTRSFINCTVILVVFSCVGLVKTPLLLLMLFLGLLTGIFFASLAMTVTAWSKGYEFFIYYYTLFVTPSFFLSGIFFPTEHFPKWLESIALALPLTQMVYIARELYMGRFEMFSLLRCSYVLLLGLFFFWISAKMIHKRLIK